MATSFTIGDPHSSISFESIRNRLRLLILNPLDAPELFVNKSFIILSVPSASKSY